MSKIFWSAAILAVVTSIVTPFKSAESLPTTITDETFWHIVTGMSETGGDFKSQLTSNEMGAQFVIPELKQITKPGGVYLGVGPEQNFTYIAALEPKIAFVIDIRRQNMLEHLIYKAVFEISANRSEFVSKLFSRKQPGGLQAGSTAQELFQAYDAMNPDSQLFDQNLKAIKSRLIQQHHFELNAADQTEIDSLFKSFNDTGPGFWVRTRRSGYYGNLMVDTDKLGVARSYLATEHNFQIVRDMERKNLIIPLVGDFTGPKALRDIGQYLQDHNATVTAFYISNVEDYLVAPDIEAARRFYNNVRTLPIDESSMFIRTEGDSLVAKWLGTVSPPHPTTQPGDTFFTSLIGSMKDLLQAFDEGRIQNMTQVIKMSRKP